MAFREVDNEDVRFILSSVHRNQVGWMILVGIVLLFSPDRRFGPSYSMIIQTPGGHYVFAVAYLAIGLTMGWAVHRQRRSTMSWALFAGAQLNWFLGVFLLLGAFSGPSGVLGAPFALYVGRHMFLQSALLADRRSPLRRLHFRRP